MRDRCLLFPKLELWHGVLITAFDVVFLLALRDSLSGRPARLFEWGIAGMVLAVFVCMCIIVSKVDVQWGLVFEGHLLSRHVIPNGAFSPGIIGTAVSPHSLFFGSAFATQDQVSSKHKNVFSQTSTISSSLNSSNSSLSDSTKDILIMEISWRQHLDYVLSAFRIPPPSTFATRANQHADRENNSLEFVEEHVYHGVVDVTDRDFGERSVFYGTEERTDGKSPAVLFDAYVLIRNLVDQGATTLLAIALLGAG
ncbi:Manganese transporter smf1 [Marasmius sp. AFHP31]|nr:Manganese transporter smf1 [Marasmius sp. AFHP31]